MSIESEIGKPEYKDTVHVKNAHNRDIIKVLESQFPIAVKHAAPIAYRFKGPTRMDTARNLFNALKNDIQYQKDGFGYQDIRLPRRFWHTRTGDCKSFTLNTLAIWHNLYPGDEIKFKYASYDPYDKTPSHVYGVVKGPGENPIIIDGCWMFFNSEKTPSFTQQSKNMDVRVLSGVGDCGIQFTPEAKQFYNRIYSTLPTQADRERFKDYLKKKMLLELNKEEYVSGGIDEKCMYENICSIEGIGRASKAERKAKRKARFKKFLHWFNAAALFLGRASFLLFVALNVNGLASKLGKIHEWGKDKKIMDTWYTLGGNTKKFLQIIQHSAKKKKLFLSKKAKEKYEARYGPLSPNEVTYEQSKKSAVHGIYGPELGAAAVAVVPVLAALVPKIIDGFRSAAQSGHPEAAKYASGMIAEGHDLVDANQANGYPADASMANAFLPPGQTAMTANAKLDPTLAAHGGGLSNRIVFDIKKFYTPIGDPSDTPDQQAYDAATYGPSPGANTDTPAASDTGAVVIPPDAPNANDQFNQEMATLGPLLKGVATVGLATAGSVMSQSKNPNIRKWGGALDGAESALTGQALRKAGYHSEAKFHESLAGPKLNMAGVLFWAAVFGIGYEVLNTNEPKALTA